MKRISALILFSLIVLVAIVVVQHISYHDGKLHVIFCDVGQGDGIIIRTPENNIILIYGGPNDKILDCLASHTAFWERNIDLVLLSHTHSDHITGLISVFQNYHVEAFATENVKNKTKTFDELFGIIAKSNLVVDYLAQGDTIEVQDVQLHVVGPSKSFLEQNSISGFIPQSGEFSSLVLFLEYKKTNLLFTGDSQAIGLHDAMTVFNETIDILQIPHHGSLSGLNQEIIDILKPDIAVISVGLHNKYNHPNPFTLSLLNKNFIPIVRTDKLGNIEFVSDGEEWVKK